MTNRLDDLWRQMGDTFGELPFGLPATISAIQEAAEEKERERLLSGDMTRDECERQYRALLAKMFPEGLSPEEIP